MVMCLYVMKYEDEITEPKLSNIFKNFNYSRLRISNIKSIKISKIKESTLSNTPLFAGKIFFKKKYYDFDYDVGEELIETITDSENTNSIMLQFIIFPSKKLIIFYNSKDGKRYGSKILSQILFIDKEKVKQVNFFPTKILEAYKKGQFSDI